MDRIEKAIIQVFSIKELFEERLEKIWEEASPEWGLIIERGYSIQNEVYHNQMLFIGANPAYDEKPSKCFYNNECVLRFPYFKKFPQIANYCGLKWSHIDLFFIRETNQKIVESRFYNYEDAFLKQNLEIAREIIQLAQPKVIVVSNAFASKVIRSVFETRFDSNIGTHRIINNKALLNVPIFFTSMLTGQRALDNGSFERLKWHIKFVLNQD